MPRISSLHNTLRASNYATNPRYWTREFSYVDTGFYVVGPVLSFIDGGCVIATGTSGGQWRIARLTDTGQVVWTRTLAHTSGSYDQIAALALDRQDNIIIGINTSTNNASIVKFDKDLNKLWERSFTSNTIGPIEDVTTDVSGNIYVTSGLQVTDIPRTQLMRINSSGTLQWARRFDTSIGTYAYKAKIRISFSESNFYIGIMDARPSSPVGAINDVGIIIARGDTATGNITWAKFYRSTTTANQRTEFGYGFTLDSSENPIVGGVWQQVSNFDLRPDFLVIKFDSSGNLSYQRRIGFVTTSGFEQEGMNQGGANQNCVTCDSSGNIYVVGKWYAQRSAIIKINPTFSSIQTKLFVSNANGQTNQTLFTAEGSGDIYVAGNTSTTYNLFLARLPGTTLRSVAPMAITDVSPTIVDPNIEVTDLAGSSMTNSGTTLSTTTNFSLTTGTITFADLVRLTRLPWQARLQSGE